MNINDYQTQIGNNATAIAEIDKELEMLRGEEANEVDDSINNRIDSLEMRKASLQQTQAHAQEIVQAYNNMKENIIGLRNLSEATSRDDQDRQEIMEEQERREAEIINSRNVLPEELQEQIRQELLIPENKLEENLSREDIVSGKFNTEALTTEQAKKYYRELAKQYQDDQEVMQILNAENKKIKDRIKKEVDRQKAKDDKEAVNFKKDENGNIEFFQDTDIPKPRDRKVEEKEEEYQQFLAKFYKHLEDENYFNKGKETTNDKEQSPLGIEQKENPLRLEDKQKKKEPLRIEQKENPLKLEDKQLNKEAPKDLENPKRGLITIMNELSKDLEIKAKTGKKYKASNIKVAHQFKKEIHSGNYLYNVVHFVPALVKSAVAGVKKFVNKYVPKMKLSDGQRLNMMTLKERIDNLSENDIMTIYNEYRGSRVLQERFPSAINVLLQEKINEYAYGKLEGLNGKIEQGYQVLFGTALKVNEIDEKLANNELTAEQKADLQQTRQKMLEGKADLVKNIRNNYVEANQWMSGGLHGFDEDMKAATTKLSYVGKRFVKEKDLNNELLEKQAYLEQLENKAIAEGNDEQALNAFIQTETLLSGETEIKNSLKGKRSVGDKYYMPKVTPSDYRDDPFVRDVFTTVAAVTAGIGAINAIKTHGVEADKILANEQAQADRINATNQQAMDQVHQTGQDIANKQADFQQGLQAQTQGNIHNVANTYERYALDKSAVDGGTNDWAFNDVYHNVDSIGHEATRQLYETTAEQMQNIAKQASEGAISHADALAAYSKMATDSQTAVNNLIAEYLPTFEAYQAAHPQFDLEGLGATMNYLTTNPEAIANMNQGMVDVVNMGENLSGVSMEAVQALQSLPSDMYTTLLTTAATAGLAYKVASTTENNARNGLFGEKIQQEVLSKGQYGDELTDMVNSYTEYMESKAANEQAAPKKAA